MNTIPFFNTYIHPKAINQIKRVLDTTFISEGKLVAEFEKKLELKAGLLHPVTVNSGTAALHLALVVAGIGPGDEVIIPAQTFVATGLVVLMVGAKPVFVDIIWQDGNIDPKSMIKKITKKTKAIIPVHWGGYPCDMDTINKIAHEYHLTVIEDAAHAFGAQYKGKTIGSISEYTCFSFQAIKHVTTGDGGAIACKSLKRSSEAKKLRWFGIDRINSKPSILGERVYDIDQIGYKYHLNDYGAVLGLANLANFKERNRRRQKISSQYRSSFKDINGITLFNYEQDRLSANWIFGMHVEKRKDFIKAMADRGVITSIVHRRIDHNSVFGGLTKGLLNQERFEKTQINIPVYDTLTDDQVSHIILSVKKGW